MDLKFEYLEEEGSGEFENADEDLDMNEMMDFLPVKSSLPITNNPSLVKEGHNMLSAIKEISEQSDISQAKTENIRNSSGKNSPDNNEKETEKQIKRQLKEIEELNLLEVKDSFEIAGSQKSSETNSDQIQCMEIDKHINAALKKRTHHFLEDYNKIEQFEQKKTTSHVKYNFSEKAKLLSQKLQRKSLKIESKKSKIKYKSKKKRT